MNGFDSLDAGTQDKRRSPGSANSQLVTITRKETHNGVHREEGYPQEEGRYR
uniref:Uncharacterized protein n=1 Tax=Picea glauca TaxID=3330 RepID=A0A101M3I0_PICGL|nr:hypothetical protein ABT39_MTgene60 [Picea glauca]QHR90774.1 hypothetical protein Q903MT_gene4800 [Picea sitchensis]